MSFVTQYRYDEPNHYLYPPDIHAVYAIWSHFSPQALAVILACPGTGKSHVTLTNAADSGDYTYINWSRWYGTNAVPGDYPVLYDRLLSNHGGNGVNVAQVNNVTFWDPGAKWLKNFAETHPSYEIPIPK